MKVFANLAENCAVEKIRRITKQRTSLQVPAMLFLLSHKLKDEKRLLRGHII